MAVSESLRDEVMQQAGATVSLQIAFIGVSGGLFDALAAAPGDVDALAKRTALDVGYLTRWCDAAYAFGYLDEDGGAFSLTERGAAFCADQPGTLMGFAVSGAIAAHMASTAARCLNTGERPGEEALYADPNLAPLFGPMLEVTFGAFFAREVLPKLPIYQQVADRAGLVVDLGCGNGWYVRALAAHFPTLRAVGLDMLDASIQDATRRAAQDGLSDRVRFALGDLHDFPVDGQADLIAMNRALHHVWDRKAQVFEQIFDRLAPGGAAVIWEPAWPDSRAALRHPAMRGLAFQNLAEHVQGNHFLRPDEIVAALEAAGLHATVYPFAGGRDVVIVGQRRV